MESKIIAFARHLDKKILWENEKELTLYAVTSKKLMCRNDESRLQSVHFDESRLLFDSQQEFKDSGLEPNLCAVKSEEGGYTQAIQETDIDIENQILLTACQCAEVSISDVREKTRKAASVEVRQIHFIIRQKFTRVESLAATGIIYDKDHATVLSSIKKIINALDGFNIPFREKYRPVFELIKKKYPKKASSTFNLDWL